MCLFIVEFSFVLRYLMAIWCIFFMRALEFDFEMFRLTSLLMECSYIAPFTPAAMVMRGFPSITLYDVN